LRDYYSLFRVIDVIYRDLHKLDVFDKLVARPLQRGGLGGERLEILGVIAYISYQAL
jgi:hypothetical protein